MEKRKIVSAAGLLIMAIGFFLPWAYGMGVVFGNPMKMGLVSVFDVVLGVIGVLCALGAIVTTFVPNLLPNGKTSVLNSVLTVVSAWILLTYHILTLEFGRTLHITIIGLFIVIVCKYLDPIAAGFKAFGKWVKENIINA